MAAEVTNRSSKFVVVGLPVIVIIVLVMLYMLRETTPHLFDGFRFPPFQLDMERVKQQEIADGAFIKDFSIGEAEKKFMKTIEPYNRLEAAGVGKKNPQALDGSAETLHFAIREYLSSRGIDNYKRLGLVLQKRTMDVLLIIAGRCRKEGLTLEQYISQNFDQPELQEFISFSGDFLYRAVRSGLISPTGQIEPGFDYVVRLLFKYRWIYWISDLYPMAAQLSPFEMHTYLRWKVELNRSAGLKSKLEAVAMLEDLDKDYPAEQARGILYAQEGQYDNAAQALWEAFRQNPFDFYTIRYLDILTDPRYHLPNQ